ncbi:hypothetical protein [Pyxidicoccus trucidator]|uniref:hypothetical protein n=1 Tax=Pyxidicoccus trucidator TaxID=2709662 RepID=UPI0013DC3D53|nr:hypothetical protein [Pyxidicoccus trucidator]
MAQTRGMLGLFYAVRDNFDLVARLSAEQRLRLLNRFGDSEAPWNMKGVWAWDDTEVLVLTGQGRDSLELIRRQHWES